MDRAEIGAIVITIFFPLLSVTFINCTIEFFKKWAIPGLFFFILYFLLTVNRKYWFDKRWRWLDSNRGTLGSDCSANRATTTAQVSRFYWKFCCQNCVTWPYPKLVAEPSSRLTIAHHIAQPHVTPPLWWNHEFGQHNWFAGLVVNWPKICLTLISKCISVNIQTCFSQLAIKWKSLRFASYQCYEKYLTATDLTQFKEKGRCPGLVVKGLD